MFKKVKDHLADEINQCRLEIVKLAQPESPRLRPYRVIDGPESKRGIDPRRNFHVEKNLRKALFGVSVFIISTGAFLHFKKTQFASYFQVSF